MRAPNDCVPATHEHLAFRTTCGRDVQVGQLALGDAERRSRRVALDIGGSPGHEDATWTALTPREARQLAAALLAEAAAAEHPNSGPGRVEVSYLGELT
jgi:hypothetical protein